MQFFDKVTASKLLFALEDYVHEKRQIFIVQSALENYSKLRSKGYTNSNIVQLMQQRAPRRFADSLAVLEALSFEAGAGDDSDSEKKLYLIINYLQSLVDGSMQVG